MTDEQAAAAKFVAEEKEIKAALAQVETQEKQIRGALEAVEYWKKSDSGLSWSNLKNRLGRKLALITRSTILRTVRLSGSKLWQSFLNKGAIDLPSAIRASKTHDKAIWPSRKLLTMGG